MQRRFASGVPPFLWWASGLFVLLSCTQAMLPAPGPDLASDPPAVSQPYIPSMTSPVGKPLRLRIPAIGVDAAVDHVGLTPEGDMDVPTTWMNVGWYKSGPRPGETGNAVIDGHLDSETDIAVFWHLRKLKPGDTIEVDDDRGRTHVFRVTRTEMFAAGDATASEKVFGSTTGKHLNLVTCDGTWSDRQGSYSQRLAVFSELAHED